MRAASSNPRLGESGPVRRLLVRRQPVMVVLHAFPRSLKIDSQLAVKFAPRAAAALYRTIHLDLGTVRGRSGSVSRPYADSRPSYGMELMWEFRARKIVGGLERNFLCRH